MGRLVTSSPCSSTARAHLAVVDPDGALLKCTLIAGHVGRHVFHMEWGEDPHAESVHEAISRYLASRRDDPDFMRRLRERIERDGGILKRLADDEEGP